MGTTIRRYPLHSLGLIAARGPDARKFLQGQLSQDVLTLGPAEMRLAGCHNPQGRVLAVLWLVADGEHDVLALCPSELLPELIATLRRVTLRAKVTLADETANWRLTGLAADTPAQNSAEVATPASAATLRCFARGATGGRWIALQPASSPDALAALQAGDDATWMRLEIADGLPQLTHATRGEFVAQMLNLDVLGGIAFDKGCYTGQEVIARAHYRGRVKRRAQRFRSAEPASAWPPGSSGRLTDGRRFQIVISAAAADGGSEWLAVTTARSDDAANTSVDATAVERPADAQPLPLPFALPD